MRIEATMMCSRRLDQSICSFLFNPIISWFDLARVLLVVTPYKVKIDGTESRLGIRAHKKSETSRGECAMYL